MKKNVCKFHGELTIETAYICKSETSRDGVRLRCKECSGHRRRIQYLKDVSGNIKKAAQWKRENRDLINSRSRQDRLDNPDKYKKWYQDYKERGGDGLDDKKAASRLKMSIDQYYEMLQSQGNKCAICNREETRMYKGKFTRLCVDHCHKTGKVRAMLCHSCNTGIGKMEDSIEILQSAIEYLRKHK